MFVANKADCRSLQSLPSTSATSQSSHSSQWSTVDEYSHSHKTIKNSKTAQNENSKKSGSTRDEQADNNIDILVKTFGLVELNANYLVSQRLSVTVFLFGRNDLSASAGNVPKSHSDQYNIAQCRRRIQQVDKYKHGWVKKSYFKVQFFFWKSGAKIVCRPNCFFPNHALQTLKSYFFSDSENFEVETLFSHLEHPSTHPPIDNPFEYWSPVPNLWSGFRDSLHRLRFKIVDAYHEGVRLVYVTPINWRVGTI